MAVDAHNKNEYLPREARSNTLTMCDQRPNLFLGGDAPPEDDVDNKYFLKKSPR